MARYMVLSPDGKNEAQIEVPDQLQGADLDAAMEQARRDPELPWKPRAGQQPSEAPSQPPQDGYMDHLVSGASAAVRGLGTTAQYAGGVLPDSLGGSRLKAAGEAMRRVAGNPNVPSAMGRIAGAFNEGRYGDMFNPSDLAKAGLEAVPQVGAIMAGGALGGAVAGPAGALGGAALTSTALNAGTNLEEAAQHAGEDPNNPSGMTLLRAGAATAGQAALDTFGVRGGSSVINRLPGQALRSIAAAGREGVGMAGADAAHQALIDGQVDPGRVAAAALTGAAARGGLETGALARSGAQAVSDQAMSRFGVPEVKTVEEARAIQQANAAVNERLAAATGGKKPDQFQVIKNLHTDLAAELAERARDWRDMGAISDGEYREVFRPAVEQAAVQSNTLSNHEFSAFGRLDETQLARQSPESLDAFKQNLRVLDLLSPNRFAKNSTGPLESLVGTVGKYAGVGTAVATGNVPAAIVAGFGMPLEKRIGGLVGRMGDKLLGLSKPELEWRAQAADRAFGTHDGPSVEDNLTTMRGQVGDINSNLHRVLGLDPQSLVARAEARRHQEEADMALAQQHGAAIAENKRFDASQKAADKAEVRQRQLTQLEALAENRRIDATSREEARTAERGRTLNENAAQWLEKLLVAKRVRAAAADAAEKSRGLNLSERAAADVLEMARKSPEGRALSDAGATPADAARIALSRLDEVGNPVGPTPVSVPLDAKGRRLAQAKKITDATERTRPGEPRQPKPEAAPESGPADFTGEKQAPGSLGNSMTAYVRKTVNDLLTGIPEASHARPGDVEKAVRSAAQHGMFDHLLTPENGPAVSREDFVNGLLTAPAPPSGMHPQLAPIAETIIREVVKNKIGNVAAAKHGVFQQTGPESFSFGRRGGTPDAGQMVDAKGNPIRSLAAYNAGQRANTTRDIVETRHLAKSARDQGFSRTADVIEQIGSLDLPPLERQRRAQNLISELKRGRSALAKAELAFAETHLKPTAPILRRGPQ